MASAFFIYKFIWTGIYIENSDNITNTPFRREYCWLFSTQRFHWTYSYSIQTHQRRPTFHSHARRFGKENCIEPQSRQICSQLRLSWPMVIYLNWQPVSRPPLQHYYHQQILKTSSLQHSELAKRLALAEAREAEVVGWLGTLKASRSAQNMLMNEAVQLQGRYQSTLVQSSGFQRSSDWHLGCIETTCEVTKREHFQSSEMLEKLRQTHLVLVTNQKDNPSQKWRKVFLYMFINID